MNCTSTFIFFWNETSINTHAKNLLPKIYCHLQYLAIWNPTFRFGIQGHISLLILLRWPPIPNPSYKSIGAKCGNKVLGYINTSTIE